MGENGGCLQSCQKCCFKLFKLPHTQATVLQSCQLKLPTLNLWKRCELAEWRSGSVSVLSCERPGFASRTQGDNPGQQLYHARAEQLGELGLPGCDEALSGMGGASLTNEVPGVM